MSECWNGIRSARVRRHGCYFGRDLASKFAPSWLVGSALRAQRLWIRQLPARSPLERATISVKGPTVALEGATVPVKEVAANLTGAEDARLRVHTGQSSARFVEYLAREPPE